nr:ABC transporter ATP-binding protein [Aureimonas populi]
MLFNILLLQLNMPFEMIARSIDDVARSRPALVTLATMWAASEERQVSQAAFIVPGSGRIAFEDVGYTYGNGRGVEGISFQAERGRITFLTGETGADKSTVFRLALKSIEPDSGRILIDGVDLAGIDRTDWYAIAAVVPQDVVLINESLADTSCSAVSATTPACAARRRCTAAGSRHHVPAHRARSGPGHRSPSAGC